MTACPPPPRPPATRPASTATAPRRDGSSRHWAPKDRVALWAAAHPAKPVIEDPTPDHDAALAALQRWRPRYAASDLPAALEAVTLKIKAEPSPPGRTTVVVLGDQPASAAYWTDPMPAEAQSLGQRATVLVGPPSSEAGNVQLSALTARRRLVLSHSPDGGSAGAVALTVRARRFAAGAEPAQAEVALVMRDAHGKAITTTQRTARWQRGQVETRLGVSLPLENGAGVHHGPVVIEATLSPGSIPDAIADDNRVLTTLEVRPSLRVGLIDEGVSNGDRGFQPGDFISRALSPRATTNGSGITLQAVAPAAVNPDKLDTLDAAVVLRPDLLPSEAWPALAGFAERGGLVWVVTPAVEGSAVWTDPMRRAFELDWRIGLEPFDLAALAGGLGLDTAMGVPEPLQLVGAGWGDLLRPVRVSRKIELLVPEAEAWLALADRVEPAPDDAEQTTADENTVTTRQRRRALLAHRDIGDGSVLLLASALNAEWTNLPTKPLFVPLLHETLRGVLGSAPRGVSVATAGDRPTLEAGWRDVHRLRLLSTTLQDAATPPDSATEHAVRPAGDHARAPAEALGQPGVWGGVDAADQPTAALLAVNVDADAGDTRPASDPQIDQWFSQLGDWAKLDPDNPAAHRAKHATQPNLGWSLLWVVLILIAFETVLARLASHAKRETGVGLGGRVLSSLGQLRGRAEPPNTNEPGRAA